MQIEKFRTSIETIAPDGYCELCDEIILYMGHDGFKNLYNSHKYHTVMCKQCDEETEGVCKECNYLQTLQKGQDTCIECLRQ